MIGAVELVPLVIFGLYGVMLVFRFERRRLIVACFFFQAEDGIRDKLVTGVQTCALPISAPCAVAWARSSEAPRVSWCSSRMARPRPQAPRSEERRVGKECRSRWSPY